MITHVEKVRGQIENTSIHTLYCIIQLYAITSGMLVV